jgi:hypothetical protein
LFFLIDFLALYNFINYFFLFLEASSLHSNHDSFNQRFCSWFAVLFLIPSTPASKNVFFQPICTLSCSRIGNSMPSRCWHYSERSMVVCKILCLCRLMYNFSCSFDVGCILFLSCCPILIVCRSVSAGLSVSHKQVVSLLNQMISFHVLRLEWLTSPLHALVCVTDPCVFLLHQPFIIYHITYRLYVNLKFCALISLCSFW